MMRPSYPMPPHVPRQYHSSNPRVRPPLGVSPPEPKPGTDYRVVVGVGVALGIAAWALWRSKQDFRRNAAPMSLTLEESDARVAELEAMGCEVKRVELPNGDIVVLKRCP